MYSKVSKNDFLSLEISFICKMYSREELKQLQLEFWHLFKKRCQTHPSFNSSNLKWVLNQTKIKNVVLRFEVGRKNAKVMIELQHKSESRRLKAYEILEKYKVIVEEGFKNGLNWEFYHQREDNKQEVCRISTTLENVDLHRQDHWTEIYDFFIINMLQLETNFLEVSDILREELRG